MADEEARMQLLGERIRLARKRLQLSQEILAHRTGRKQFQISEYENANRRMYAHDLPLLAKALNVPISYFFQDEDETDEADELEEVLLHEFRNLSSDDAKQFVVKHLRDLAQLIEKSSTSE